MNDPAYVAELAAQASTALESWVERYGGIASLSGANMDHVQKIVGQLDKAAAGDAAAA